MLCFIRLAFLHFSFVSFAFAFPPSADHTSPFDFLDTAPRGFFGAGSPALTFPSFFHVVSVFAGSPTRSLPSTSSLVVLTPFISSHNPLWVYLLLIPESVCFSHRPYPVSVHLMLCLFFTHFLSPRVFFSTPTSLPFPWLVLVLFPKGPCSRSLMVGSCCAPLFFSCDRLYLALMLNWSPALAAPRIPPPLGLRLLFCPVWLLVFVLGQFPFFSNGAFSTFLGRFRSS